MQDKAYNLMFQAWKVFIVERYTNYTRARSHVTRNQLDRKYSPDYNHTTWVLLVQKQEERRHRDPNSSIYALSELSECKQTKKMQLLWLLVAAAVACMPLHSVEADCQTPWKDCGKPHSTSL